MDAPTSAQLDNENGFLTQEVVIGNQAVKVDAGNAQVLQTEQVGAEDKADDDESYSESEDEQGNAQEEHNEGSGEDSD